jgi:hypothetical protein
MTTCDLGGVTGPVQFLVFGIPIDAGYQDIARLLSRELKIWIEHGPKDLTPADRARTELVNALADELRQRGRPSSDDRGVESCWYARPQ